MTSAVRICILIPHYEHAEQLGPFLERLEPYGLPCILVDDGSSEKTRRVLRGFAAKYPWIDLVCRETNGGQGAAKRTGYYHAVSRGFTHAIEMDADGQHAVEDIPLFVSAMRESPSSVILGTPKFGDDCPTERLWGRQLSRGLVWAACCSTAIDDPLCGYRGMPLNAAIEVEESTHTGDRMSHDPEFAVRLFRAGLPIVTIETRVVYPDDGLSHFDLLLDNLTLAATYIRLLAELPFAAPWMLLARRRASELAAADAAAAGAAAARGTAADHEAVGARASSSRR